MKAEETLTGTQECPECHHTSDIIFVEGEEFPSEFLCPICGYSSPTTWKKEPRVKDES